MTYLELIAAIGTVPMDMAHMYFNGKLTGKEKAVLVQKTAAIKKKTSKTAHLRHFQGFSLPRV